MLELDYARRSRRHGIDMLCEVVRDDCDDPVTHRVEDLSAYGAWIQTSFPMEVGSLLALTFTPPSGSDITLFAKVRRTRARRSSGRCGGMGVEFVGVDQGERLRLLMWLRHVPDEMVRVLEFGKVVH